MAPDPLQPPSPRRIVVKLGTNVIMRPDGRVALGLLCGLVESIAALHQLGHQILVVSSGSIGLGMERLGLHARPTDLAQIQACAATGQSRLMSIYEDAFDQLGCRTAQVLLTEDDFRSPTRHANLARTLEALLALGVIPVINENDTVSVAELDAEPPEPTASTSNSVISTEGDAQQSRSGETCISPTTEPALHPVIPTEAPSPHPVISTEAKRSGETCGSTATEPTTPTQSPAASVEALPDPVTSTEATHTPVISTEGDAQQSRSAETCIPPTTEPALNPAVISTKAPSLQPVISTEAKRSGETCISPTTEPSLHAVISTEGDAQQSRSGETCISPTTEPTPAASSPTTPSREKLFGDNDKLSALVATHIAADLLILLSDVDGLYDRSPADPAATLLRHIPAITPDVLALAHGGNGRGRGGMLSKLEAARIAQTAGLPVVIANGRSPHVLEHILTNHPTTGTRFPASTPQPDNQL